MYQDLEDNIMDSCTYGHTEFHSKSEYYWQ